MKYKPAHPELTDSPEIVQQTSLSLGFSSKQVNDWLSNILVSIICNDVRCLSNTPPFLRFFAFHSQRSKCSECASFARMIVDRPWIKGPNGIHLSYSATSIWCLYDCGAAKTKSAAWRNFMADCIKKQTQTCSGLLGKPIHKCTQHVSQKTGNSRVLHRCPLSQPTWWDKCCPSEQPPPVWCSWTCTWTGPVSRHVTVHLVVEEEHRRQKVQKKEHKILACVQTPPVVRTAASYWYTHLL